MKDIIGAVETCMLNPKVAGQHGSNQYIGNQKEIISGPFSLLKEDKQAEKAHGTDPDGK